MIASMEHRLRIGFTGTKRGMTVEQNIMLRDLLVNHRGAELHHGDCVGADAEAHDMAEALGLEPVIHPPIDDKHRAYKTAKRILPEQEYLRRNRHIVDDTDRLIAAPGTFAEALRSGTWSTVRYARQRGKQITVIDPSGKITMEGIDGP